MKQYLWRVAISMERECYDLIIRLHYGGVGAIWAFELNPVKHFDLSQ